MFIVKKACHFDKDYLIGERVSEDVLDMSNIGRLKDMGILEEAGKKADDVKKQVASQSSTKSLEEMSKAELIKAAQKKGVTVDKTQKKSDILAVIQNGNVQL